MTAVRTDSQPAFPRVTVETVTTLAGVANLRPEYERLGCGSACVLPFSLREWHLTWCRHFLGCNPHIEDEPLFYILRNFSGACVAILPFVVSRRGLGPVKIVSISLLGADPAITEIRIPMVESGYELLTARAARGHWPNWPIGIGPSAYEPRERLRSRLASSAYSRARSEVGYPSKLLQRLGTIRRIWN